MALIEENESIRLLKRRQRKKERLTRLANIGLGNNMMNGYNSPLGFKASYMTSANFGRNPLAIAKKMVTSGGSNPISQATQVDDAIARTLGAAKNRGRIGGGIGTLAGGATGAITAPGYTEPETGEKVNPGLGKRVLGGTLGALVGSTLGAGMGGMSGVFNKKFLDLTSNPETMKAYTKRLRDLEADPEALNSFLKDRGLS